MEPLPKSGGSLPEALSSQLSSNGLVVVLRLGSQPLSADLIGALSDVRSHHPAAVVVVAQNPDRNATTSATDEGIDSVVRMPHNVGYAAAINAAFAQFGDQAAWVLVLTDDVAVHSGSLATLIAALDTENIGIAAPGILTDGRVRTGGTWHPRWGWARQLHGIRDDAHHSSAAWADGACLAIDGALFEQLGGFDEQTFLYGEDVQFCLRAKYAGHRLVILPSVLVSQASGMRRRSGAHGYLVVRNEILTMRELHRPPTYAVVSGIARAGLELVRVITEPTARRHHARQAVGMAWGVLDGVRHRFGPPPQLLATWGGIPCIDRTKRPV